MFAPDRPQKFEMRLFFAFVGFALRPFLKTGHKGRARLVDPLTVRASGEIDQKHGDTIHMSPREDRFHRFDAQGMRLT